MSAGTAKRAVAALSSALVRRRPFGPVAVMPVAVRLTGADKAPPIRISVDPSSLPAWARSKPGVTGIGSPPETNARFAGAVGRPGAGKGAEGWKPEARAGESPGKGAAAAK